VWVIFDKGAGGIHTSIVTVAKLTSSGTDPRGNNQDRGVGVGIFRYLTSGEASFCVKPGA
jgi:hypothetical protein